jgi:hypothetical protein
MLKKQYHNQLNQYWRVISVILISLFLFSTLILFALNQITTKLHAGNSFEFLTQTINFPKIFHPNQFGHQIGQEVVDEQYGNHLIVRVSPADIQPNGMNYLNIGPKIFLLPGKYTISFDLAGENLPNQKDIVILDIYQTGNKVWATKIVNSDQIKPEFQPINFSFETEGGRSFEFRIYYLGQGNIKAGNVIIKTDQKNYQILFQKILLVFKHTFSGNL